MTNEQSAIEISGGTTMTNEELFVNCVKPEQVSEEDLKRLDKLGFFPYKDTHVSFKLAKLLKDNGFPQELGEFGSINTTPYYTQNGGLVSRDLGTIRQSCCPEAAAPTNQSVLKYIRERMGFIITVTPRMLSTGTRAKVKRVMGYKCAVIMPNEPYKVVVGEYDKWEHAEEAGIEYILNNIIKPKQNEGI